MKNASEQQDFSGLPVTVNPEILGGTPVFAGTRVPIDALRGNLASGATLDEFLDWFPTVARTQAEVVLHRVYPSLEKVEAK